MYIVTKARNDIAFAVGQIDVDTITTDTAKTPNEAHTNKAKSPHDGVGDIQPKIEVDGDEEMNIHDVRVEGNKFSTVDAVCDVTDGRSVQKVINEVIKKYGRIDVVVKYVFSLRTIYFQENHSIADFPAFPLCYHSATGYGVIGATEDQDEYDIKNQIDTNFMGVYNIMRLTLPYFRERRSGRYIIFSSSAGLLGIPGYARMFTDSTFFLEVNVVDHWTNFSRFLL